MNVPPRPRLGLGLAALLTAACSSVPLELRAPDPALTVSVDAAEFPGATRLLRGFDQRDTASAWQDGDRVLFGLRLKNGTETRRWLLRLEVALRTDPGEGDDRAPIDQRSWHYTAVIADEPRRIEIDSRLARVRVTVHDQQAELLGESSVFLPADLMTRGLLPGVECALTHQQQGGDFSSFASVEQVRPMAEGLVALIALLQVVQNDDVLEDYFWQVVQKPSVWSVIAGFGVRASLTASLEKSTAVTALPAQLPAGTRAYATPLRVDVNDNPALLADVVVVDAARPYALCAGIVAATARHPNKPDVTFDVQLLAARSGSGATQP
ncbi:MAG: hypothetical protein KDE27_23425 [Planctomycetes bacterium]|nr:hypothetical protein [Planctomycetota bacterium]